MALAPETVTVATAARELNLSIRTIRSWITQRRIGYVRLGRAIRIPSSEVKRLVREGTVKAEAPVGAKTAAVSESA